MPSTINRNVREMDTQHPHLFKFFAEWIERACMSAKDRNCMCVNDVCTCLASTKATTRLTTHFHRGKEGFEPVPFSGYTREIKGYTHPLTPLYPPDLCTDLCTDPA